MGNDTTCSRLCEKKSKDDPHHDEFLNTEYIIPCQICNQQFKHQALKSHIDLNHYASIKEEHDGSVKVECLLCHKPASDLVQHGNHIKNKHKYADSGVSKRKFQSEVVTQNTIESRYVSEEELNITKQKFAEKLNGERQFQILSQLGPNHYQASVRGVKYEVRSYIKDYRGAEYNEEQAEAELIWFNVFKAERKCRYYYFDLEPGQRNILCKAYIFMITNQ